MRRVPLHEPFTLRISEIATFSPHPFGYKRPCPIDPSRVELYKFHVLKWEPCPKNHSTTVTSLRMGSCTRKITSSIAARGYNNHLRFKPVDSPIIQIPCHNPRDFSINIFDEIESKIFDEKFSLVFQRLLIKCM